MLFGITATAIVTKHIQPLYESTVKVNVERRGNGGVVGQQASMPAISSDVDQMMTTQVELIQSDPVLRPTTEKYRLLDLENQFAGLTPAEANRLRAAPIKLRRLKVARENNTYLIKISYRAHDPQLAADVANMIAASYVAHAFDSRDRSYVQVAEAIQRKMRDLQSKMLAAGEALTRFNKQMNIIDPEQRVNMLSARLLQLDTDFTSAQSDRLRKEAIFEATKSGKVAAAQVSAHAANLEELVQHLNAARQELAVVRTTYAENHPEYKRAQSRVAELETQFRELRINTLQRVEEDYKQALSREEMARKLVGETKGEADLMNAKAFEYQQLKSDADNYKKVYEDLQRVTGEEEINRSFQDAVIQVEDPARAAAKQAFPVLWLNLLAATLLSALAGIAGVFIYESVDTRLRTAGDAAKLPNVRVIASLPKLKQARHFGSTTQTRQLVGTLPKQKRTRLLMQYHESIRALRNSIDFVESNTSLQSLLVTSAGAGEGKSTIAANLAFSYALLGKKVLLIDGDMRRPALHRIFDKQAGNGLAEYLEHRGDWTTQLVKIAREHLFLLPSGIMSERSADLVSTGVAQLLEEAYKQFDLVILDAPPLLSAPESAQMAAIASGVLVVTRANFSRAGKVAEAYELLNRARARVVGMVIDDVLEGGMENYGSKVPQALPEVSS